MSKPQKAAASSAPAEQKVELTLLDQIVEEGRFGREAAATERGKDLVKEFVVQVLQGEMAVSRDAEAAAGPVPLQTSGVSALDDRVEGMVHGIPCR